MICNSTKDSNGNSKLSKCKDVNSWGTLYDAAERKNFERILSLSASRSEFPSSPVTYHRLCRINFTIKRGSNDDPNDEQNDSRPTTRSSGNDQVQGEVLPPICIFCKKEKYKSRQRTREPLISVQEFNADEKVRKSTLLHIQQNTDNKEKAESLLLLFSKDLMSWEAKYHASCYKPYVKIFYDNSKIDATNSNENVDQNEGEQSITPLQEDQPAENVTSYNFRAREQSGLPDVDEQEEEEMCETAEGAGDYLEDDEPVEDCSDNEVVYPV